MNFNEAKTRIEKTLADIEKLATDLEITVKTEAFVECDKIDTERQIGAYGFVEIKTENMRDDDALNLEMRAETKEDGSVDEEKLNTSLSDTFETAKNYIERIKKSDNAEVEILAIGKEIDKKIEDAFAEERRKDDEKTKKNLHVAMIATLVMVAVAVIAILIDKLV